MRCLVTGVAGFVGSSLCDRLLRDGHEVLGIDCFTEYYSIKIKRANIASALKHPKFSFVEGNLLTLNLDKHLDGVEWVFHQAAQAGVRASWGKSFDLYVECNITATQKLLEYAKDKKGIKKIVYASSSSVYGNAETFPTPENINPQPVSPYGVTKLAAEHLMVLYAKEFAVPTVSLRYFTVFGPRQRPDMAFNRFILAGLKKEEIIVFGTGEQSRDFTYIDDAVEANLLAAKFTANGEVFNIGGGTQAQVNEVLDMLQSDLGSIKIKRTERQIGDALHTSADTTRAKQSLGFAPKVSLKDGLLSQVSWMRENLSLFS